MQGERQHCLTNRFDLFIAHQIPQRIAPDDQILIQIIIRRSAVIPRLSGQRNIGAVTAQSAQNFITSDPHQIS